MLCRPFDSGAASVADGWKMCRLKRERWGAEERLGWVWCVRWQICRIHRHGATIIIYVNVLRTGLAICLSLHCIMYIWIIKKLFTVPIHSITAFIIFSTIPFISMAIHCTSYLCYENQLFSNIVLIFNSPKQNKKTIGVLSLCSR